MKPKVAWFSTGRDQAALDLLAFILKEREKGNVSIDIPFVFSNRDLGEAPLSDQFLNYVTDQGLPLITFSSARFNPDLRGRGLARAHEGDETLLTEWRESYDREIAARLSGHAFDLIFLAGYMLVVGPSLCEKFRILNLHPAPPGGPKGTWEEVMHQLIQDKAPYAGAQIHQVTRVLDEGPPWTYFIFPVTAGALFDRLRSEELKREFPLILMTLKRLGDGSLTFPMPGGIDLSREVEAWLKQSKNS
jgi:phosphoribosylglycinamide formyltransferase-1